MNLILIILVLGLFAEIQSKPDEGDSTVCKKRQVKWVGTQNTKSFSR